MKRLEDYQNTLKIPDLNNDFYAQSYELRKNNSTMTLVTVEWLKNYFKKIKQRKTKELSLLSVGSGEGEIDFDIIDSIIANESSSYEKIKYTALEPNTIHREHFIENLRQKKFPQKVHVSLKENSFEEANTTDVQKYDFILFIQVMYYFDNPHKCLQKAISQLKADGQIIVVNQSDIGIPQLQKKYMHKLKGNENKIFTSNNIKQVLSKEENILYYYDHKNAYLKMTECFKKSEIGLNILSFCMECDLRKAPDAEVDSLLRDLKNQVVKTDEEIQLYEPIDVFVLNKKEKKESFKFSQDDDPVDDYRQISQKFDWQKELDNLFFLRKKRELSDFRFLDIACGTGRWLKAFTYYVKPKISFNNKTNITYDLLDFSKSALEEASLLVPSPFKLNSQFSCKAQEAAIHEDFYDVIWSMHGFYAFPKDDLALVIKNIRKSLTRNGSAFIAQASRSSFYIDFYQKYLEHFDKNSKNYFNSAEDIIEVLKKMKIEYEVHVISYYEKIDKDDNLALSNYILKEAIHNSFDSGKTKGSSVGKNLSLKDLFTHKKLSEYLKSLMKGSSYFFPEEVWLIKIKK